MKIILTTIVVISGALISGCAVYEVPQGEQMRVVALDGSGAKTIAANKFTSLDSMEEGCLQKKKQSCFDAGNLYGMLNNKVKAKEFYTLACEYGSKDGCTAAK